MNNFAIFENNEFGQIRTIEENGVILFCGKDVAEILGYSRTADAIRTFCKGVCVIPTPTNGGIQKVKFIPESDLYRLIINSKLPTTQKFEKWVMDEVLPSIRKTGQYGLSGEVKALRCKVEQLESIIINTMQTKQKKLKCIENVELSKLEEERQDKLNRAIYNELIDFVQNNSDKFADDYNYEYGKNKQDRVFIKSNVFNDLMEQNKYDSRQFLEWANYKGLSDSNKCKSQKRLRKMVRFSNITILCIGLKLV